jgi:hypothetical protein
VRIAGVQKLLRRCLTYGQKSKDWLKCTGKKLSIFTSKSFTYYEMIAGKFAKKLFPTPLSVHRMIHNPLFLYDEFKANFGMKPLNYINRKNAG